MVYVTREKDRIEIRNVNDDMEKIELEHIMTCYHCGSITTQDVTIHRPKYDDYERRKTQWCVIFSGAMDFEGNKKDMLKRYPEFRNITCDLK